MGRTAFASALDMAPENALTARERLLLWDVLPYTKPELELPTWDVESPKKR